MHRQLRRALPGVERRDPRTCDDANCVRCEEDLRLQGRLQGFGHAGEVDHFDAGDRPGHPHARRHGPRQRPRESAAFGDCPVLEEHGRKAVLRPRRRRHAQGWHANVRGHAAARGWPLRVRSRRRAEDDRQRHRHSGQDLRLQHRRDGGGAGHRRRLRGGEGERKLHRPGEAHGPPLRLHRLGGDALCQTRGRLPASRDGHLVASGFEALHALDQDEEARCHSRR
mmetsp:Transcript_25124/g.72410  ORF Transcript_25124/g.72410 Transcript_25124/m.72410 type:complete len:225 (+) Transcript_25124:4053-4727(+)